MSDTIDHLHESMQILSIPSSIDFECMLIAAGRASSFMPAELPPPDFAVATFAGSENFDESVLNYDFEPYNCDAHISLLPENSDISEIVSQMLASGRKHFSHFSYGKRGVLCLWKIPSVGIALGGFESGGGYACKLAQDIASSIAGGCLPRLDDAHFEIESSDISENGQDRMILNAILSLPPIRVALNDAKQISKVTQDGSPGRKSFF